MLFLLLGSGLSEKVANMWQMWVSINDWHENPDIIHTKFA